MYGVSVSWSSQACQISILRSRLPHCLPRRDAGEQSSSLFHATQSELGDASQKPPDCLMSETECGPKLSRASICAREGGGTVRERRDRLDRSSLAQRLVARRDGWTDWCVFRHPERYLPQAAQHGPCRGQEGEEWGQETGGQQPTSTLSTDGDVPPPQTSAEFGRRIRKCRVGTNPTRNRSQWDAAVTFRVPWRGTHCFQLSDAFLSASPRSCRSSHAGPSLCLWPQIFCRLCPSSSSLFPFFHPPSLSRPLSRPPAISSSSTVDLDHHYCPLPTFNPSLSLTYTVPRRAPLGSSPSTNARAGPNHLRTSPSSIHQFHRALTLGPSPLLANCLHIPGHSSSSALYSLTCRAVPRSLHPYTLDTRLELTTATTPNSNYPFPHSSSTQQIFQNAVV